MAFVYEIDVNWRFALTNCIKIVMKSQLVATSARKKKALNCATKITRVNGPVINH